MKKKVFFIFTTFVFTKTLLGLTFYPFSQVKQILKHPVLFPVIFSPFLTLFSLFILGRITTNLVRVYNISRSIIAIILGGSLFAILFWQGLLFYLLISFFISLRKN